MSDHLFSGVCTALVTPFHEGKVNLSMLDVLLDRQIESKISAVILFGTTGEAPTLSDEEKIQILTRAKYTAKDRCLLVAGTGSNATAHAITLSKQAEDNGADALLIVSPYYNKSTSEGLYQHYKAIAEAVHIPIILYNVPSRTGVDIPVSVYQRLAEIPNIVGVKEATTDIKKILKIRCVCPKSFAIWCGNDDLAVPYIACGANGLISVLSNLFPGKTKNMVDAALYGNYQTAMSMLEDLLPIIDALFCEVNPIPIKEAMKIIGYDCGICRLPLWQLTQEHKANLCRLIEKKG